MHNICMQHIHIVHMYTPLHLMLKFSHQLKTIKIAKKKKKRQRDHEEIIFMIKGS